MTSFTSAKLRTPQMSFSNLSLPVFLMQDQTGLRSVNTVTYTHCVCTADYAFTFSIITILLWCHLCCVLLRLCTYVYEEMTFSIFVIYLHYNGINWNESLNDNTMLQRAVIIVNVVWLCFCFYLFVPTPKEKPLNRNLNRALCFKQLMTCFYMLMADQTWHH